MFDADALYSALVACVGTIAILMNALVVAHRDMETYRSYCSKLNKHARLLGKEVEAKVYEGSEWERMVVVAVSWRGAVCVRPVHDLTTKGRWIHKSKAPGRVRWPEGDAL